MAQGVFSRGLLILAGILGCGGALPVVGCEPKEEAGPLIVGPTTSISVAAPGPGLITSYVGEPKVSWPRPALDVNNRSVSDDDLRRSAMEVASVVEWPSGSRVPGKWVEGPDDFNAKTIVFERDGEPSGSWEAVLLDGSKMPKEFGGSSHVGGSVVYSPVSRPVVSFVNVARIMIDEDGATRGTPKRSKGNDLVAVIFTEELVFGDQPFAEQQDLDGWVQVQTAKSGSLGCRASWDVKMWPGPVLDRWSLECPPLPDGETLTIRLKGEISSSSGASLAAAYSRTSQEDVSIEVTIPGPDAKEPGTPREADSALLLEQAGVPTIEEK